MTKKLTILVVGLLMLGIIAFVFNSQINSAAPVSAQSSSPDAPDQIAYRHLFRHAAAFKAKADELERQGKDAQHLRGFFKHKADLTDAQAQIFDQIAVQCVSEMKLIDDRAKPIIEAYKAQYPNGQVPHGQLPAPPPAELHLLTQEKNNLVLRKRDDLRAAFGEDAFKHFQDFVKNKIAPNVQTTSAEQ